MMDNLLYGSREEPKPLTRPLGDLSHKGRGIPSFITVRITSPLVGEVAQRAGEGYSPPFSLFNLWALK